MADRTHDISWTTIWRVLAVVVFGIVVYFARDAVVALLFAIIISSAVDGPVAYLSDKFRLPRIIATALLFALGIMLAALAVYIVFPVVILEITSLAGQFAGTAAGTVFKDFSSVVDLVTKQFSFINIGQITEVIFSGASPVVQTIGSIVGGIAFGVSVLIISFYLTLTKDGVGRFLRAVLPERMEDSMLAVYYRSKKKIGRWLQAQLLLSVTVGVLVAGGLWILGVRYSLVIGLLAALLEIMPFVGPIFSGAIGVLIALSDSFSLGVYTLLLFIAVQQIEGHLLIPIFMKKAVDIHPVVALFSMMVGFQLLGIIGILISIPVAVVIQDVLEARFEKKRRIRLQAGKGND